MRRLTLRRDRAGSRDAANAHDARPDALGVRAGLPLAVAGSLAATMIAAPAQAADDRVRWTDTTPTGPTSSDRAGARASMAMPDAARIATIVRRAAQAPEDYVVAPGDTVWGIADRYGLRVSDVLAWNALGPTATIFPGQVLTLSSGSSAPVSTISGSSAPAPSPAATHTVVAGDTLFAIARSHSVSLSALLATNALAETSVIHPGQTIAIPGAPASSTASGSAAPAPAPAPSQASHTVAAGDTLSAIAAHHGVALDALFAANGLGPGSIIYPGQSISIPSSATPASAQSAPAAAAQAGARHGLDDEQIDNVRHIIRVGRELGVPDRGIAIALATAMVESWIRNLDWGDRDSLGLFQQRPSTGWGTPDQVRDTDRSIRTFFGGPSDPNGPLTRGLLDVAGWEDMSFTEAAQAVQISAYPDRYGQWESAAYAWLATWG